MMHTETQDRRTNRTKGTSRGNNSQSARGCRWSNIGWQILDQSKRNWKRFGIKPTATHTARKPAAKHTTTTTKPPITVICVLTPAAVFHGRMISLTQHTPAVVAGPGGKKVKFQLAFEITKTLTASPDSVCWHRCRALLSTRCPRHGGGRGGWMGEVFLLNHLPLTKQSSVNRAKNKELKCWIVCTFWVPFFPSNRTSL